MSRNSSLRKYTRESHINQYDEGEEAVADGGHGALAVAERSARVTIRHGRGGLGQVQAVVVLRRRVRPVQIPAVEAPVAAILGRQEHPEAEAGRGRREHHCESTADCVELDFWEQHASAASYSEDAAKQSRQRRKQLVSGWPMGGMQRNTQTFRFGNSGK